jgi:SPP1 family phage portal protein
MKEANIMEIASEVLADILESHEPIQHRTRRLYDAYAGKGLPIESKTTAKASKINNILKNSYRSVIIDQINSFVFSRPITFGLDNTKYDDSSHDLYNSELQDFLIRSMFDDVCAETGKFVSCCGHGYLLAYTDEEGKEMTLPVPPWEALLLSDKKYELPTIGIRYYPVIRKEKGKEIERTKVEIYDNQFVHFYVSTNKGFVLDPKEEVNPLRHNFDFIPLIKIVNNAEEMGDFERVETLIDAYDRLLSSEMDEIEQFAHAYLLVTGYELDEETLEAVKSTGAFSGMESTDRIEFITKQVNDTFLENVKSTLNENIYKFSGTVDYSDEKFSGGGESGESRKWKLLSLENRAQILTRKFSKGLREFFKVICSSWSKKGLNVDYLDIWYQFQRNLPVDALYVAEIGAKLMGIVSEDTRLAAMSGVVDDIEFEKKMMEMDREGKVDLSTVVVPVEDEDPTVLNPGEIVNG